MGDSEDSLDSARISFRLGSGRSLLHGTWLGDSDDSLDSARLSFRLGSKRSKVKENLGDSDDAPEVGLMHKL